MECLIDYLIVLSLSGWMWNIQTQDYNGKRHDYHIPDKEVRKVVYGSYSQELYDPKSKTIYLCPGRLNIEGRRQGANKNTLRNNKIGKRKR